VALDPPRERRNMAVPGPLRLVRMAVSARLCQHLPGFRLPQRFGIAEIMRHCTCLVDPISRAREPYSQHERHRDDYRRQHFHREFRLQRSAGFSFPVLLAIRLPTRRSLMALAVSLRSWVSIYGLAVEQMDPESELRVKGWTARLSEGQRPLPNLQATACR